MAKTAEDFNPSASYAVNDLCMYGGVLYIFTSAHSGAWDAGDVRAYDDTFELDFNRIINGMDRAIEDTQRAGTEQARAEDEIAYADSMVFEESLIEGTRYRYTFQNPIT